MEVQDFGPLVKRAAKAKGISQGRLGYLLTDDEGPFIDSSRVRLLYEGKWRLTHATVERLIDLLAPYLDPAEAWTASGLLPPGVTADMLRKLDLVGAHGNGLTARYTSGPGQPARQVQMPAEVVELIRRNRRLELVAA